MMRRLESLPQLTGIADQTIARVKRFGYVKAWEAPGCALRICSLIVTIQARGDILGMMVSRPSSVGNNDTLA